MFTPSFAARPGEQVQIDTTPLDVLVVFDDGLTGRPELTIAVDVATRTICAAVLRPENTKAVDAALLLARILVPELMRPGWSQALAASWSVLPYERLVSIDERFEHAAAKPVIVPETISIDHGKVFVSATFLRACEQLGISVQPAHPATPTDKSIVERSFGSIATLFCQHVAGYTGRDVVRRGAYVAGEAAWRLPELAELLQEWVVVGWQNRPHEGLRHPLLPDRVLSPNDAFAAMVAAAGYLPVPLSGDDYIALLPVTWRAINDYGIRIGNRTYDAAGLGRYRRQPSGVTSRRGLWEIRHDPYDLSRIWVRDHHADGWICAEWTHLPMVAQPFGDVFWRQASRAAASRNQAANETVIAAELNRLLTTAHTGPGRDRIAAARSRVSTAMPLRPLPPETELDLPAAGVAAAAADAETSSRGDVVPLGIFDPEEDYR